VTVTKEITRLEKSSVRLNVTVGKDDVRSEYDALLSEYTKVIQIPGFRKGKVPRDVLIRKLGDILKSEALGKIIEKSMDEVLEDENFPRGNRPLPYSTPSVEEEPKLDLEKDLQFSVVYDVLPEVKVDKWEGIEVEVPDVSVSDEDLARELELIRERNSIVLDKDEDAAAAPGDVVTVDYGETGDSGEILPGSERKDFSFTLGSGLNVYKFDDEITGMKKGETKEFSKAYPEDFEEKTLAGETIKIRLTLTALKEKKLPDLDDDLAQDVDEKFETLDDLKNSIRERLEKELENRLRNIKVNKLLEKMMESTPVEIPESMIRMELDSRWRNLARRFNTDSDGLYKMMGNSNEQAESILESWKPDAMRALHSRLIVETLIEELKLEASDDEVEDEIEKQAMESGSEEEEVRKYYEEEMAKEYLKEDIKEKKFFDLLLEKNIVKKGEKANYMELVSKHDHDHDHDDHDHDDDQDDIE
jgi:trigger factor